MPSITRTVTIEWGGEPGEIRYAMPTGYDATALQIRAEITDAIGGNPWLKPEGERDAAACEDWLNKRNARWLDIARIAVKGLLGEWESIDLTSPEWVSDWIAKYEYHALGLGQWVEQLLTNPAFEVRMKRIERMILEIQRTISVEKLPDELKPKTTEGEAKIEQADPTPSSI